MCRFSPSIFQGPCFGHDGLCQPWWGMISSPRPQLAITFRPTLRGDGLREANITQAPLSQVAEHCAIRLPLRCIHWTVDMPSRGQRRPDESHTKSPSTYRCQVSRKPAETNVSRDLTGQTSILPPPTPSRCCQGRMLTRCLGCLQSCVA